MGPKIADKEGSFGEQQFIYKTITTVKECVHATCEYNGEWSVQPMPSEVLDMEGRYGDLKAREENS